MFPGRCKRYISYRQYQDGPFDRHIFLFSGHQGSFHRLRRPVRQTGDSFPSTAEVKKAWSCSKTKISASFILFFPITSAFCIFFRSSIILKRRTYLYGTQERSSLHIFCINLLKPTGYVTHQQFNIQQLYALPTLYLCVLYLSENKQRLVPLTA